jgi:hypothetical protein
MGRRKIILPILQEMLQKNITWSPDIPEWWYGFEEHIYGQKKKCGNTCDIHKEGKYKTQKCFWKESVSAL